MAQLSEGMADFQYQPDMSDPVAKLRLAMDTMDGIIAPFSTFDHD